MPEVISCEASVWRSVCRVTFRPASFMALAQFLAQPFWRARRAVPVGKHQSVRRGAASPRDSRCSCWAFRWARSSDTTAGEQGIDRRPRADSGDLNRRPLRVCSTDRSTCSLAPSRSTSCQRKAQARRAASCSSATTAIGNSTRPRDASTSSGIWTSCRAGAAVAGTLGASTARRRCA